MGDMLFAGRQRKPTSARLNNASNVQREKMVTCWEIVQVRNENSMIPFTKAKLGLKLSCITPHAFVSMRGTTANPCIFTLIIATGIDHHLRDAAECRSLTAHG